jgi:hypothetical protein
MAGEDGQPLVNLKIVKGAVKKEEKDASMLVHQVCTTIQEATRESEALQTLFESELSSMGSQPYVRLNQLHSVKVELFSREYQVLTEPSIRPPTIYVKIGKLRRLKVQRLLPINCSLSDFHTSL